MDRRHAGAAHGDDLLGIDLCFAALINAAGLSFRDPLELAFTTARRLKLGEDCKNVQKLSALVTPGVHVLLDSAQGCALLVHLPHNVPEFPYIARKPVHSCD
jgi:hypothetical protein